MEKFDVLATKLEPLGIRKSNLFGMTVLKLGKRPVCGLEADGIMFKLDPETEFYAAVRSMDGVRLFAPTMKNGRSVTMRNWVVVPFAYADRYMDLAQESIRLVAEKS